MVRDVETSSDSQGVVASSAMRLGLIIAVVGLVGFAVTEAVVLSVQSPWWVKVGWPAFIVLGLVGLWQSLTASIRFDGVGVRARPYPWRRIALRWSDIAAFQARSGGIYAVVKGSRSPVLLLEFGRYRWQVRERQAALDTLEQARALHLQ